MLACGSGGPWLGLCCQPEPPRAHRQRATLLGWVAGAEANSGFSTCASGATETGPQAGGPCWLVSPLLTLLWPQPAKPRGSGQDQTRKGLWEVWTQGHGYDIIQWLSKMGNDFLNILGS